MRVTYDPVSDVVAFELTETAVARTKEQGGGVVVALAKNGNVLGVQVFDASKHFEASTLAQLQSPVVYLSLLEAAEESGLTAGTLRVLLNNGRLKGEKRGRDWFVTAADLDTYLESRAASGRPAHKYQARRSRPMLTGESKVFTEAVKAQVAKQTKGVRKK
jgi:excisionase family DNA binding protein